MNIQSVTRWQLLNLLEEVAGTNGDWVSIYLTPESLRARHERPVLESRVDPRLLQAASFIEDDALQRESTRTGTGLVLLQSDVTTIGILPPFPVVADSIRTDGPDVQPLLDKLKQPHRLVLVLVTWNAYVLALYQGESLLRHKKGTAHIHAPHKKGGSSQARFARRTQNQRAEFLRRVGGNVDELFGSETIDYVFFGGNRLILRPLLAESRFLRDHAHALLPRVLPIKRATLDSLDGALRDACSSTLLLR